MSTWLRTCLGGTPHPMANVAVVAIVASGLLLTGCPKKNGGNGQTCEGDFCLEDLPHIELVPNSRELVINETAVSEPGDSIEQVIRITNTGTAPLKIDSITIDYEVPEGGEDAGDPALALGPVAFLEGTEIFTQGSDDFPQAADIRVIYTRPLDSNRREATLNIASNDPDEEVVKVDITTESGAPRLTTDKPAVDFALVPKGSVGEAELLMLNVGALPLHVSGFAVSRDPRFGVKGSNFQIGGLGELSSIDLPEAITIPKGESRPITITFSSDAPTPAEGLLRIFSDDPTTGSEGYEVPLIANKSGPCIQVTPRELNFRGKLVGTFSMIDVEITSCGTEPLELTSARLDDLSSTDFGLCTSDQQEDCPESYPSSAQPWVIDVNETVTVPVTFVPGSVNPKDANNVAIPDQGTLILESNAFEATVKVPIIGAGAEAECPVAVINVKEDEEVPPQTVLHLDGTASYAPFGKIDKYAWTVASQPEGSQEVLVPSTVDPKPIFAANVVGVYVFELEVWDETGKKSCEPGTFTVLVQPDKALHVELTWVTPGDDDETDTGEGAGSDVDLHFTHPSATGPDLDKDGLPDPWFDEEWDCFWHNTNPNWASFDPAADDDPSLDRDDTDGAGPENLNLGVPEEGASYRVGVHYWDDHGLGNVVATIKVFHYADLVYTATEMLEERDMWCVGHVDWGEPPTFTTCEEDEMAKIVPDYVNPFFFSP